MNRTTKSRRLAAIGLVASLTACGGGDGSDPAATDYTLGGGANGISTHGLVLRNADESLSVPVAGSFTFITRLEPGARYAVRVSGHPSRQTCSVANAEGTMARADVTSLTVECVADPPHPPRLPHTHIVGGLVTGLTGSGLVLRNGLGELAVVANGAFAFTNPVPTGLPYSVTVVTQPSHPRQACTVSAGSGTIDEADISSVAVHCGDALAVNHAVGGSIRGL
jgi:hypothetical protein